MSKEMIKEIESLIKEYGDIEELDGCQGIKVIEWGDWTSEGKCDVSDTVIEYKEKLFCIRRYRSGSYYTDYTYFDPYIYPVEAKLVTKTVYVKVKDE